MAVFVNMLLYVSISRNEGKPEDVLNPKKKQLEKITPVCALFSSFVYF